MRVSGITTAASKLSTSSTANENKITAATATLAEDNAQFLHTIGAVFGMGASDLERVSALALSSDAVASSKVGLTSQAALYGYAPDDSWDRVRTVSNSAGGFGSLSVAQNVQVLHERDANQDDSDKTFTVPADTLWHVEFIYVKLSTTATSGNRTVACYVLDSSSNECGSIITGSAIAANTGQVEMFIPGVQRETTKVFGRGNNSWSPIWLAAGDKIRVFDDTAVDAGADDMITSIWGQKVSL